METVSAMPNEAPVSRKEVDEKVELILTELRSHKTALLEKVGEGCKLSAARYVQIDRDMKSICDVLKPFVKGQ